jgi:hypothetical protein
MKKLYLIAIFTLVALSFANAQELGVRFGGTNGAGGVALDGVFGAGPGRIHADLGFYHEGVGIDVLWDFINKPLGSEAFSWYLGAGPTTYIGNNAFWLGLCGEIGLEYDFKTVPIAIGADWRPTLWVVEETKFGYDSFGLNVRFRFGK